MSLIRLDRLLYILDENKVKYPKKFKDIEAEGYDSNRCEFFSYELRGEIERLIEIGINNGFDVNVKNAIFELAEMMVNMTKYNASLKLDYYAEKRQIIVRKIKDNKGDRDMADIKEEIYKYIDNSIAGADSLIAGDLDDYKKSIIMSARDMLLGIRETVDNAFDNSSTDAAHRARYVIGDRNYALYAWRESVARGMIYDGVNKHLEEAQCEADKWCELVKEVSKRKMAKDADIAKFQDDLFSSMTKRGEVKEKGDAFFSRLKSFESQFEIQSEAFDNVNKISEEIQAIQRKIADIIDRLDRGEILQEEALLQIEILQEDEELKKMERDSYRAGLNMIAGTVSGMKRLLQQFRRLELIFNMYQKIEPNMFYATFSDIDFNRFLDVMSFGASEAEIVSALSYYETVMETVQSQTMHMAQLDNRFAEANKLFDAMKRPVGRNTNAQDREKEKKEQDDKLAALRKQYNKPAPEKPVETQDKESVDDDLAAVINKITKK